MKKIAVILIVLGIITRVVCCGKSVELNNQIMLLNSTENNLAKDIEHMLLVDARLTSFTYSLSNGTESVEYLPVSNNTKHISSIALSQ